MIILLALISVTTSGEKTLLSETTFILIVLISNS